MSPVSIITLTWNGYEEFTKQFLESLKMTTGVGFEVILVDNGSAIPVKHKQKDVLVLNSNVNLGFSGGNNFGAEKARHDLLLFMNDDILVEDPGWLEQLVEAKTDENIVGAHLIKGNAFTEFNGETYDYLGGWCVLISKKQFEEVGKWDADFGLGFFEDVWLSLRAKALGYELKYVKCDINHLGSKTVSKMDVSDMTKFAGTVYRNKMSELRSEKIPSITFYYDGDFGFTDGDYEGRGVGGAESALIQLTRKLSNMGWYVEIYNNTMEEGIYNNVHYKNFRFFDPQEYRDVFVLYRNAYSDFSNVRARTKIFFSCDQATSGDWSLDVIPYADHVICISDYHKSHMLKNYNVDRNKIIVMDLGVKKKDYENLELDKKIPGKMIFCSVPLRGLEHMAKVFPLVKEKVPEASLVITSDYRLWGADAANKEFVDMFSAMDGVNLVGTVPRKELVEHQKTAEVMSYPCTYDENFCISAMECIAAGTVPITFNIGAMKTTVADSGVVLDGKPGKENSSIALFALEVIRFLKDKQLREGIAKKGHYRAMDKYTWEFLGPKFDTLFRKFLDESEVLDMHKCDICKKEFDTSFEMFKHRAKKHKPKGLTTAYSTEKIFVVITTTKPVELSINRMNVSGTELRIPKQQSLDVVRILKTAYGEDIIYSMRTLLS